MGAADVKRRLPAHGREPGELLTMPAAPFALGGTCGALDQPVAPCVRATFIRYSP